MPLLTLDGVKKSFGKDVVVNGSFKLDQGEQVALIGPSGCGKSTLLHLISGVLRPEQGSIMLQEQDITKLGQAELDGYRARTIGYVFQSFHLLDWLTALENVEVAVTFAGKDHYPRAAELLNEMGLENKHGSYPRELSVGQRQRVAVARAIVNSPPLVLADEPTANLDKERAESVVELLRESCRKVGAALLLVSHDEAALSELDRLVQFQKQFGGTE